MTLPRRRHTHQRRCSLQPRVRQHVYTASKSRPHVGDGFTVPMQFALDQGYMSVESMMSGRAGTGGNSTIEDLKAALVEVNM